MQQLAMKPDILKRLCIRFTHSIIYHFYGQLRNILESFKRGKAMNRNYDTTPVLLRNDAKGWFSLYKKALQDHEPTEEIAGIYCLLFALELHLKAYLSLKDKRFAKEEKLRWLSHNLNSIFAEVSKVAPPQWIGRPSCKCISPLL